MKRFIKDNILMISIVVLGIIVTSGLTLFLMKDENKSLAFEYEFQFYCADSDYYPSLMLGKGYVCCPNGTHADVGGYCIDDDGSGGKSKTKKAYELKYCSAGTYYTYNNGTSKCVTCPANSYCPGGNFKHTNGETQGKYACQTGLKSKAGSTKKDDCTVTCQSGTYYKLGCAACPKNYYCPGVTFKGSGGSTGIFTCPAGANSELNSSSIADCKCSAGTYYDDKQNKCLESGKVCISGIYDATSNTCCEEGQYDSTSKKCRIQVGVGDIFHYSDLDSCEGNFDEKSGVCCKEGTYSSKYRTCLLDKNQPDTYENRTEGYSVCKGGEYIGNGFCCDGTYVSGSCGKFEYKESYKPLECQTGNFNKQYGVCCAKGTYYDSSKGQCTSTGGSTGAGGNTSSGGGGGTTTPTVSKYRLSYLQNASGVTVTGMPTTTEYEKDTKVLIPNEVPRREYYKFIEWNTKSDGSGNSYNAGNEITMTANLTLYAIWEIEKYTLTYDGNVTEVNNLPNEEEYDGGSTVKISDKIPTRDGYFFVSWNTKSDYKGESYKNGDSLKLKENTTLYAQWRKAEEYKVIYNVNGGTGLIDSQIKIEDKDLILTTDAPEREGYIFKGWSTSTGANGTIYEPGSVYNKNKMLLLYAQWEAIKNALKYEENASGDTVTGMPNNSEYNNGNVVSVSTRRPEREGYKFTGWNTKKDGSGTSYKAGNAIKITEDLTLYAQWTKLQKYTVSYNVNGGTGNIASQTKSEGIKLTLTDKVPTKQGYTFKYWSTNKDGSGQRYSPGSSYTIDQKVTLYAQWEEEKLNEKSYSVIFNVNGGEGYIEVQKKYESRNLTITSEIPTKEGYTFIGWNTKPNGTGETYLSGSTYSKNETLLLYAQWEEDLETLEQYKVMYHVNGGTGIIESQIKYKDRDLVITKDIPVKEGDTFNHWNTKSDGTGDIYKPGDTYKENEQLILYAQWNSNENISGGGISTKEKYTIKYDLNGGKGKIDSQTKEHGKDISINDTMPERKGYIFVEWNTKSDGSGKTYSPMQKYKEDKDVTLYAQWTKENSAGTIVGPIITLLVLLGGGIGGFIFYKKNPKVFDNLKRKLFNRY